MQQRARDRRALLHEIVLNQRRNNWIRWPDDPDQRWGASNPAEWKMLVDVTAKAANMPQLPQ